MTEDQNLTTRLPEEVKTSSLITYINTVRYPGARWKFYSKSRTGLLDTATCLLHKGRELYFRRGFKMYATNSGDSAAPHWGASELRTLSSAVTK
jgi:hypothetical protein